MRNIRGQSLFEVVIAVGVITVVLVALVGLIVTTQKNTNVAKDNFQATKLAQELSEWIRGERDTSWLTFYSNTAIATSCFDQLAWGNTGTCSEAEVIPNTNYYREATFVRQSANQIHVTVTVRWTDGQGGHSANTETTLTNWRNN